MLVRGRLDSAMALDTFIGYSSQDKTAADAACAVLERAGIRCWIAPRDIRPGQEYGHAIIEAIDQCRVMVLIFSANANDSRQIHREIERAVSKGVPIIPLRIEEVVPTRSMEYFLGAIHWLDALTPPLEKHLQQLAEAVKALLQIDVAGSTAPLRDNSSQASTTVRPAEPAMQGGRRAAWSTAAGRLLILLLGVAAACIALLIGGVWHYLMREPAAVTTSAQAVAASLSRTVQSGIMTEVAEQRRLRQILRAAARRGEDYQATHKRNRDDSRRKQKLAGEDRAWRDPTMCWKVCADSRRLLSVQAGF